VYDPENPNTYWESGIYNDGGVFRTDDGGATFQPLGNVTHIDAVSVDLTDPDRSTLLAGAHEQSVLLRSGDGGTRGPTSPAACRTGVVSPLLRW
jgi:photosystem II stability/assembly factor-like uncharacterized protein